MTMNRRDFLTALGFGAGAVAFRRFNPTQLWTLPDDLVPDVGQDITPQWLAAEVMRIFLENIEPTITQLADKSPRLRPAHLNELQQFGCSFIAPKWDRTVPFDVKNSLSREEVSKRYIQPAATQMAMRFNDIRPKYCFPLELPGGYQQAARARNESFDTPLDLRYIRVYDIMEDNFLNRLDMLVA